MESPQIKKRQHQVPRFVLERFASPLTGKVWNYDKQAGRAWPDSVEDTACERHLYRQILSGEELSGQDWNNFASFVAIMYVRSNAFRRLYAEIHGNIKMMRDYLVASDDSLFESQMERFQADRGKISDDQKQELRSTMLDPSSYTFLVDREYTLKALGYHDQLAPLLSSLEWTIMVAPKGDWRFITSDNPVVQWVPPQHHHPFRGTSGFRNTHAEVIFPLSSDQCWVGHWLKGAPTRLETTAEWVKQTNRITVGSAERFLYSHIHGSGILRLAKKYAASQSMIQMGGPGPVKKAEIRVVRSLSSNRSGTL